MDGARDRFGHRGRRRHRRLVRRRRAQAARARARSHDPAARARLTANSSNRIGSTLPSIMGFHGDLGHRRRGCGAADRRSSYRLGTRVRRLVGRWLRLCPQLCPPRAAVRGRVASTCTGCAPRTRTAAPRVRCLFARRRAGAAPRASPRRADDPAAPFGGLRIWAATRSPSATRR